MEGYRINPDEKHTRVIMEGLLKKGGYCPCKVQKTEDNLCPCNEFLETEHCHCNLWVKKEEVKEENND